LIPLTLSWITLTQTWCNITHLKQNRCHLTQCSPATFASWCYFALAKI
jgi:hypothetical protein